MSQNFSVKWRNPWPKEAGWQFAFLGVWNLRFAGGGRTFGIEILGVKFEWRTETKLFAQNMQAAGDRLRTKGEK